MPSVSQLGSLSRADLASAWERVLFNAGCAGADGVTVNRFGSRLEREIDLLWQRLTEGSYRPFPLLLIEMEKKAGQPATRQLLVPSVRDRLLQTAVSRRLSRSLEEELLDVSFGYRPGRGVDSAVARVQQWRDRGYVFVVEADITGYFDHVDHTLLLNEYAEREASREFDSLLRAWVRADVWDGTQIRPMQQGIPQGSPLSPVLANLFLADFDTAMAQQPGRLVRYADDFVMMCRSQEDAEAVLKAMGAWMEEHQLTLKAEKTGHRSFGEGFTFLGVFFHGDEAFQPWKRDKREGRIVFMAKPMSARMVARYLENRSASEMEEAFAAAGFRQVAPGQEYLSPRTPEEEPVAYLYVTEQGAVVRKSGDRFLIEKEGQVLLDLPYHKLEAVLVFGGVQITSQALGEMLEKRITVSFFSRNGRYRGSAVAPLGNDVQLRMNQYALALDGGESLRLSRQLVQAKLANGRLVLARYANREPGETKVPLEAFKEMVEKAGGAATREELLGYEGAGARLYFGHVMGFQKSEFAWPGRVKHPSTDPINALLSLIYTMLWQELAGMLEGLGLDPACGFFHQPDFGRRSLAFDLVEPFRGPAGDRLVITMLNRKMVGAEDFYEHEKSTYLKTEPLRTVLEGYEKWMIHVPEGRMAFREALRRQAEGFVRHLQKKGEWSPYLWVPDEGKECFTSSVTI